MQVLNYLSPIHILCLHIEYYKSEEGKFENKLKEVIENDTKIMQK